MELFHAKRQCGQPEHNPDAIHAVKFKVFPDNVAAGFKNKKFIRHIRHGNRQNVRENGDNHVMDMGMQEPVEEKKASCPKKGVPAARDQIPDFLAGKDTGDQGNSWRKQGRDERDFLFIHKLGTTYQRWL